MLTKQPLLLCRAKLGQGPNPAPVWVGNIIARILLWLGPKGLEFGRYSIDYHYTRNFLYVMRNMGAERAQRHIPEFARRLVQQYDKDGAVSNRWGHRLLVGSR
jgi:7-hydroxymethyl chlorophyll a reductase